MRALLVVVRFQVTLQQTRRLRRVVVARREAGDPIADELHAIGVDNTRSNAGHSAGAKFRHAIQQYTPVRLACGQNLSAVHKEAAVCRPDTNDSHVVSRHACQQAELSVATTPFAVTV